MEILDNNVLEAIKQQAGFNTSYEKYRKQLRKDFVGTALVILCLLPAIGFFFYWAYELYSRAVPLDAILGLFALMAVVLISRFYNESKELRRIIKHYRDTPIKIEQDVFIALKPDGANYKIHLEEAGIQPMNNDNLRPLPKGTPIYTVKWGNAEGVSEIYKVSEINQF